MSTNKKDGAEVAFAFRFSPKDDKDDEGEFVMEDNLSYNPHKIYPQDLAYKFMKRYQIESITIQRRRDQKPEEPQAIRRKASEQTLNASELSWEWDEEAYVQREMKKEQEWTWTAEAKTQEGVEILLPPRHKPPKTCKEAFQAIEKEIKKRRKEQGKQEDRKKQKEKEDYEKQEKERRKKQEEKERHKEQKGKHHKSHCTVL